MRSEDHFRKRLVEEARRLLGVRFPDSEQRELSGMLDLYEGLEPPTTLSCSQFVRYVVDRAFGRDFWMTLIGEDLAGVATNGGARTMCATLDPTTEPAAGDLRFFGGDEGDDWHVMMVTDRGTLIGACPMECVREVDLNHFSVMVDQGFRRIPLPTSSC